MRQRLPIDDILPQLCQTLAELSCAVLVAEPGAGKTTRVPLALLNQPWLQGQRILMLEPRRLAAKAAARFMARSLGEEPGQTVGYRVRLDSRISSTTRLEVITEGVLTRMLQKDPALEGVGVVIFDEFHERSLQADLGLALCRQVQGLVRPDLRLLVMSATLDAEPVAAFLGAAPILHCPGRIYPVETRYLGQQGAGRIEMKTAAAIRQALREEAGDMLVFLPGSGEIRRTEQQLRQWPLDAGIQIVPLYGNLSPEQQDLALAPARKGQRKIVLATAIAETSLTVEGVRVVIDCGFMRKSRFSPRTGMSRLETLRVSRAVADQRRGRAGRLEPGVCYRLWSREEDRHLQKGDKPEILEADLASLLLELALWGIREPAELDWLTPPLGAATGQAKRLLTVLGALAANGAITDHGRKMAEVSLHPRLAHMCLRAVAQGEGGLACELAVLLEERDTFSAQRNLLGADVAARVEALRAWGQQGKDKEERNLRRLVAEIHHWKRYFSLPLAGVSQPAADCGRLLALAYPDRIAQNRGAGRFLLANGRGANLTLQALAEVPYVVAAELDDQGEEGRIHLAAGITLEELRRGLPEQIHSTAEVYWDENLQAVRAREIERLGAIIMQERPQLRPDAAAVQHCLLGAIRAAKLSILPWTKQAVQIRQRIRCLALVEEGWPDMGDEALAAGLEEWLGPYVAGLRSREDLQGLHLAEILSALLDWPQQRRLEAEAPSHIVVPSGQRIPVDYGNPAAPVLAVRLQEMFGCPETPRIAGGRLPLTLHLLSPARRPVQVTQDLANFWRTTYFAVKKDLLGRYPKHYWPEDPLAAEATHRAKPRGSGA